MDMLYICMCVFLFVTVSLPLCMSFPRFLHLIFIFLKHSRCARLVPLSLILLSHVHSHHLALIETWQQFSHFHIHIFILPFKHTEPTSLS